MAKPKNKPTQQGSQQPAQSVKSSPSQEKDESKPEPISIFTHPIKTTYCFSIVVGRFLKKIIKFLAQHSVIVLSLVGMLVTSHMFEGNHTPFVKKFDEIAYFAAYWIILGVASSIGLGTGLHTFVLYTGPHIAKVTMVANECKHIPDYLPSRWTINPTFGECHAGVREPLSFWNILLMVQLEAMLWGFGTAIGELPPYFVAKAASLAGKKDEELQELEQAGPPSSLIDRIKLLIYKNLQKYGWITILLCASIPNPLFDLAGITCGHFGIPFKTFFSATAIGKAIIKVHLQVFFVILVFSNHHVENILSFLEKHVPFLKTSLSEMLDKQKKLLHSPALHKEGAKPLIAQIWDVFIFLMIAFFAVSIINSLANGYLEEEYQSKLGLEDDKKDKKKGKKNLSIQDPATLEKIEAKPAPQSTKASNSANQPKPESTKNSNTKTTQPSEGAKKRVDIPESPKKRTDTEGSENVKGANNKKKDEKPKTPANSTNNNQNKKKNK